MQEVAARLAEVELFSQAARIWLAGGWAMVALALNALVLFALGVSIWLDFRGRGFRMPESRWRSWIRNPDERRGRVGGVLDFVMGARTLDDLRKRFSEIHAQELAPFKRDLRFMRRAVSTAPLLGLLGTVTGMLTTFHALSLGSGGDKTMEMIAAGISEALITTETGLMIALPGLFFQFHLSRSRERYETFMAHLESACTQYLCVRIETEKRTGPPPYGFEDDDIARAGQEAS
jgi:biopolymer transport protein ExbB